MVQPAKILPCADDADLVARARHNDAAAVRSLIQRHNRRLFRLARGIVRDDGEAEDVVQEGYVRAFTRLTEFRGESAFGTWLCRIVLNEALQRVRRGRRTANWVSLDAAELSGQVIPFPLTSKHPDPERTMAHNEIRTLLERAIDALPEIVPHRACGPAGRGHERGGDGRSLRHSSRNREDSPASRAAAASTRPGRAGRRGPERQLSVRWRALPAHGRCRGGPPRPLKMWGTFRPSSHRTDVPHSGGLEQEGKSMSRHIGSGMVAALLLASGAASAQDTGTLSDPQIAHIAYTAGEIDIKAAQLALKKSKNKEVRAFADDMLRDHKAVNEKALALVKKLKVTPEDNATSKALTKQGTRSGRNSASSAAPVSTRPMPRTRSPITRRSTTPCGPR